MITGTIEEPLGQLPEPGQKVRWRNPQQARAWGWEQVLGMGPYTVLGIVDHSDQALPAGLLVCTELGQREISELWLTPANEPETTAVPAPGHTPSPMLADVVENS